jgi:CRISPR-associated protein Cas2
MEGFGSRVQYSVFVSDLSPVELIRLRGSLMSLMNQAEDSVMIIDLGSAGDTSRFQFLGAHDRERMPRAGAVVL